jgi:hypothetical protein
MQAIAIVLISILAAVIYGVLHDQVTARVCVEYFTVGHPPIFRTDDPTLLGIGWGIIATWWAGPLLGGPLAVVARAGARQKRSAKSLIRPIAMLMGVNAVCALIAGGIGWLRAGRGVDSLSPWMAALVPAKEHASFIADYYAHLTGYSVGFLGGLVVLAIVWRSRIAAASTLT